jgi:hypothetical protein
MHDRRIAEVDRRIAMQDQEIMRPEAIRRLVEAGLKVKPNQAEPWRAAHERPVPALDL